MGRDSPPTGFEQPGISKFALGIVMLDINVDAEVVVGHRDHTVRLETRHDDVDKPEADEDRGRHTTAGLVDAAELTSDNDTPNHENEEAGDRAEEDTTTEKPRAPAGTK